MFHEKQRQRLEFGSLKLRIIFIIFRRPRFTVEGTLLESNVNSVIVESMSFLTSSVSNQTVNDVTFLGAFHVILMASWVVPSLSIDTLKGGDSETEKAHCWKIKSSFVQDVKFKIETRLLWKALLLRYLLLPMNWRELCKRKHNVSTWNESRLANLAWETNKNPDWQ